MDASLDEELSMGAKALFVEHPDNSANRVRTSELKTAELPWGDPAKMPFTMAGPFLAELFRQAFVIGLHEPAQRPTASEWENALVKTIDLIQPCSSPECTMKWYVFDNSSQPLCPACGTPYRGKLPVLNLYSSRHTGSYQRDNHRLMVWNGQSLFPWHVNRRVFPNEHLSPAQRSRVGYFQLHKGEWYLVNQGMPHMLDLGNKQPIPIGGMARLTDGSQFLLSSEEGGRLIQVQLVGN